MHKRTRKEQDENVASLVEAMFGAIKYLDVEAPESIAATSALLMTACQAAKMDRKDFKEICQHLVDTYDENFSVQESIPDVDK